MDRIAAATSPQVLRRGQRAARARLRLARRARSPPPRRWPRPGSPAPRSSASATTSCSRAGSTNSTTRARSAPTRRDARPAATRCGSGPSSSSASTPATSTSARRSPTCAARRSVAAAVAIPAAEHDERRTPRRRRRPPVDRPRRRARRARIVRSRPRRGARDHRRGTGARRQRRGVAGRRLVLEHDQPRLRRALRGRRPHRHDRERRQPRRDRRAVSPRAAAAMSTPSSRSSSGEGMGAGLMIDRRLVRGRRGGAGEMRFLDHVEGVGSPERRARSSRASGRSTPSARDCPPTAHSAARPRDARRGGRRARPPRPATPPRSTIIDRLAARLARICLVLGDLLDVDRIIVGGAAAESLPAVIERAAAMLDSQRRPHRPRTRRLGARPRGRADRRDRARAPTRPRAGARPRAGRAATSPDAEPSGCRGAGRRAPRHPLALRHPLSEASAKNARMSPDDDARAPRARRSGRPRSKRLQCTMFALSRSAKTLDRLEVVGEDRDTGAARRSPAARRPGSARRSRGSCGSCPPRRSRTS